MIGELLAVDHLAVERVERTQLIRRHALETQPGALGFVRPAEADATVKIVRVNGCAPGDPQYPLRFLNR